jgi:hypothetical protein
LALLLPEDQIAKAMEKPANSGRFAPWIPWRKLGKLGNLGKIRITRTSQNITFLFIKSLNACFIFLTFSGKNDPTQISDKKRWEHLP